MQIEQKNLFIVIPCWNESKAIPAVVDEINKAGFDNIIIIDDGSTDDTYEVIRNIPNVYALSHAVNRGKGAAIETGLELSKRLDAKAVVIMDGDGQHNPDDINIMLEKLNEGFDVVLGSRLLNSGKMPRIKIIHNKIGNLLVYLLYGLWVSDSQSGFRMFSRKAIDLINIKVVDRYAFDSEVIREIYRHKLSYTEIPIEVRYTKYSMSKVGNKQTFTNGAKMYIKMILSI